MTLEVEARSEGVTALAEFRCTHNSRPEDGVQSEGVSMPGRQVCGCAAALVPRVQVSAVVSQSLQSGAIHWCNKFCKDDHFFIIGLKSIN